MSSVCVCVGMKLVVGAPTSPPSHRLVLLVLPVLVLLLLVSVLVLLVLLLLVLLLLVLVLVLVLLVPLQRSWLGRRCRKFREREAYVLWIGGLCNLVGSRRGTALLVLRRGAVVVLAPPLPVLLTLPPMLLVPPVLVVLVLVLVLVPVPVLVLVPVLV